MNKIYAICSVLIHLVSVLAIWILIERQYEMREIALEMANLIANLHGVSLH